MRDGEHAPHRFRNPGHGIEIAHEEQISARGAQFIPGTMSEVVLLGYGLRRLDGLWRLRRLLYGWVNRWLRLYRSWLLRCRRLRLRVARDGPTGRLC